MRIIIETGREARRPTCDCRSERRLPKLPAIRLPEIRFSLRRKSITPASQSLKAGPA